MVAVTGANGLLGSYIVRQLIEAGEPFIGLKRRDSDISLLSDINEKIIWRDADILDPVSLDEAFTGVTHVIHSAAMVSFSPKDKKQIFKINVEGTKNVVDACLHRHVKKLVYISSVAALGRVKGQAIIDEENKWIDSPLNTDYARSKYLAELEVFRGFEEGLATVLLSPSVILAPADWSKSSAKIFKYIWNKNPFYINTHLNYVDVRDVATITQKVLNGDFAGQKFILSSGSIPIKDLFSEIATRFGKKPPSIELNSGLISFVAALENFRAWLTGSNPLITSETARLAGTKFLYQNKKLRNTFNFEFQTIDKTLDWCCKYYMERADR